jgi:hypothetical protein
VRQERLAGARLLFDEQSLSFSSIETPRANLVSGMKWLLGNYTMRLNGQQINPER